MFINDQLGLMLWDLQDDLITDILDTEHELLDMDEFLNPPNKDVMRMYCGA